MPARIYLDNNATTPVRPEVRQAMLAALDLTGNPSSVHSEGRAARAAVEQARARVAGLVGATPSQVVFTSSGTEANRLGLKASGRTRIVATALEHDAVRMNALSIDPDAVFLPATAEGLVDVTALPGHLDKGAEALVSVQLVNNETGVIQPVAELAAQARAAGALIHSDAVQAAGKIAVDMEALAVDYLSLSAHKMGGPKGIGALIIGRGAPFSAQLLGGGQEFGRRAGTENVAGIVGFGVAAELAQKQLAAFQSIARWRDAFEAALLRRHPDVCIPGAGSARVGNTSCVVVPGWKAETLVMALDLAGVAVSAGAACSSGKVRPSQVLDAMGWPPERAGSAIRFSAGWQTPENDFPAALAALCQVISRKPAQAAG